MHSPSGMPTGWKSFHRRLMVTINGLFLITMAIFLTASYWGERDRHFRATFLHLDETLGVLKGQVVADESHEHLDQLEQQLAEKTGVPHRLVVLKEASLDSAAPNSESGLRLQTFGVPDQPWSYAKDEKGEWLASSMELSNRDRGSLLLMRLKPREWEFGSRFAKFHGLHVLVTVFLFTVLLEVIGRRSVRAPIERLVRHIEQVESGQFRIRTIVQREDELGWLALRFTEMAKRLQELITRRVRAEKYSSAYASAWKTVQSMIKPLRRLDRDLLFLEGLAEQDPDGEVPEVVRSLRKDHDALIATVQGLLVVDPPEGMDLEGSK